MLIALPNNLLSLARVTGLEDCAAPLALDALNARVADIPAAQNSHGQALRFVHNPHPQGYEAGIHLHGQVPTRSHNWHDHYNALAWLAYPHAKRACNTRHWHAQQARTAAGLPGRGPTRDALTQWDECGVCVVSHAPLVVQALKAHEWVGAFWQHRTALMHDTEFFLFGHASCEALHTPYFGLCAKALYRTVPASWFAQTLDARCHDVDLWLADWLTTTDPLNPQCFSPLPLLGLPGLTPENAALDYYQDTRQFRPRRSGRT